MTHTSRPPRGARTRPVLQHVSKRIRELAEAGATGRWLAPHEVKEVCEALKSQSHKTPTRFHSGVG